MQALSAAADRAATWLDRAAFFAIAALACGSLATARGLAPDARGFGTHEQLGLPACAFRELTQLPCPGCGLTTAFAHMVRGEARAALVASPVGALACLFVFACIPLSLMASARGWSLSQACARMQVDAIGLALAVLGLLQWLARALAQLWG
jgi:Protein of unknown function (DUF2752)